MICSMAIGEVVELVMVIVRGGASEPTEVSPKSMLAGDTCNPAEVVWEKLSTGIAATQMINKASLNFNLQFLVAAVRRRWRSRRERR